MVAVGVLALLLFLLERFFPLRKSTQSLLARLIVNVAISVLTFIAAVTLVQPAVRWALRWSAERSFGLVHLAVLPAWAEFALSCLLMDLAFYYWHLANHRVPFLWRFHNVHHIDPDLDVSTAFRFHFGEITLSSAFNVMQVSLIGISTPRMHGIHHSQVRRENNSNFGTVFTWWDRLHRTLGLNIPQDEVIVGIPAYTEPEDNRISNALLMPFRRQRDYWRRSDGSIVERAAPMSRQPSSHLAE